MSGLEVAGLVLAGVSAASGVKVAATRSKSSHSEVGGLDVLPKLG